MTALAAAVGTVASVGTTGLDAAASTVAALGSDAGAAWPAVGDTWSAADGVATASALPTPAPDESVESKEVPRWGGNGYGVVGGTSVEPRRSSGK